MLALGGLGVGGRLQGGILVTIALPVEPGGPAVGSKECAQELADDRDGTAGIQDERRQRRRLMNAIARAHSRKGANGRGQLLGKRDAPLALVVPGAGGSLAGDALDVVENRFTIQRLTEIHSSLAILADGSVA